MKSLFKPTFALLCCGFVIAVQSRFRMTEADEIPNRQQQLGLVTSEQCEEPASASSPENLGDVIWVNRSEKISSRLLVRTRDELLSEFHRKVHQDLVGADRPANKRRMRTQSDENRLAPVFRRELATWHLVEMPDTSWIERQTTLFDDNGYSDQCRGSLGRDDYFRLPGSTGILAVPESQDCTKRFSIVPDLLDGLFDASNAYRFRTSWNVIRIEMIRVNHQAPMYSPHYSQTDVCSPVYEFSSFHECPHWDGLSTVGMQSFNPFERQGIFLLKRDSKKEIVSNEIGNEIQILGAVRSSSGELIAAISYTLVRADSNPRHEWGPDCVL